MRCWRPRRTISMGSLLLVCMGDDNETKGRKMLDEQEWSNCIGCFPLSFFFSRLVVVQTATSILNKKSQLHQVDVKCVFIREGP
jgi:hypothetical protein